MTRYRLEYCRQASGVEFEFLLRKFWKSELFCQTGKIILNKISRVKGDVWEPSRFSELKISHFNIYGVLWLDSKFISKFRLRKYGKGISKDECCWVQRRDGFCSSGIQTRYENNSVSSLFTNVAFPPWCDLGRVEKWAAKLSNGSLFFLHPLRRATDGVFGVLNVPGCAFKMVLEDASFAASGELIWIHSPPVFSYRFYQKNVSLL